MSSVQRRGISVRRFRAVPVVTVSLVVFACEATTDLARDPDRFLQTEELVYRLDKQGLGLGTEITYTFTNNTGGSVYLVNCVGAFALRLEIEEEGEWRTAWAPIINQCLSPPIVIEDGASFVHTLEVWGAPAGSSVYPQFEFEDLTGLYRIVWVNALSSFDRDVPSFGPQIPLDARTSNRFALWR